MAIDFSTKLFDLHQKEIMGIQIKDGVQIVAPATLGSVAADALANAPAEAGLSMADKVMAFKLAQVVTGADPIELGAEKIALIKRCIATVQSPVVVGRCFELLDPAGMKDVA